MLFFLPKFTLVWNSALPFWKLLVSEFLLSISETLHCSMSASHVKIVPLLDVHQLLMFFAGTLKYLGPGTFPSIVLYNMVYFLLLLFTQTQSKIELNYYYHHHHHHHHHHVLTLFSRLLMLTLIFLFALLLIFCSYIDCHILYFVHLIIFVYFYVLVLTL
jgi:hypothetical protein